MEKKLPPCRQPEYLKAYRKKRYAQKCDEINAYMREWHKRNPGKRASYTAKWSAANPERSHECNIKKGRKYYAGNYHSRPELRAAAAARAVNWQRANPERTKELRAETCHRRRARKYATQVGPIDYKKLYTDSNGLCGICREPLNDSKIEYDHIIPLARGGSHTQDNLQVSHPRCNRVKNARLPEELELLA